MVSAFFPMKKLLPVTPVVLFFLLSFFPFCKVTALLFGFDFCLYSDFAFAAAAAGLSCVLTGMLFHQNAAPCPNGEIFAALTLPVSLVNLMCFVAIGSNFLILLLIFLPCICSLALFIRFARPVGLAVTAALLAFVLAMLTFLLFVFAAIFSEFGRNTVVKTSFSPHDYHLAQVIESDQGALGGNTLVTVEHRERDLFGLAGRFVKNPVRVYLGEWGEADDMSIYWTDEYTLCINGVSHRITG